MVDSLHQIWLYVFNRGGQSFCEIIRYPNPHEHARSKYLHDCFRNVWIRQKYINKKKGHTNTEIQLYREKDTVIFISHFRILSSFLSAIFGAYSLSLFGFSVICF